MTKLGSVRAHVHSLFVQKNATTGEAYADHVVKTFNDLRVYTDHPVHANPHALSAQTRKAGEKLALALCKELGREPYLVQKSKRQAQEGLRGSNEIHWLKDATVPVERFNPKPEDVIVMINTDYYLEMPDLLARRFQLTVVVGFTPTAVANDRGEYTFHAENDGTFHYSVPGGEKPYVHKIWDYRGDAMTVVSTVCGMPWCVATYRVNRKPLDAHHSVTLLMPLNQWWGVPALYVMSTLEKPQLLERLSTAGVGPTTQLVVPNPDGQELVSVGFSGRKLNATIVKSHLESLCDNAAANKTRHSRAAVEAMIPTSNYAQRAAETTCVYNWVLWNIGAMGLVAANTLARGWQCSTVHVAKQGVNSYRFNLAGYDTCAKVGVIAFMPPFVDGAFAPTCERVNDVAAIEGRIVRVQPEEVNLEGPEVLEKLDLADKFIDLCVPAHMRRQMVWEDFEDVWERQNRPAQRMQAIRSGVEPPKSDVTSFPKSEAVLKPGDPRMIHQQAPNVKINYARVIGSVTKFCLKRCKWYAFGDTPKAIAEKLTAVLQHAESAIMTDYSRFDGTIGNILRDIERRFLAALCHPSVLVETLKLHRMQYKQLSKSKHGVKYFTGYSRLSGSAETSAFNTFANAFVAFVALMESGQGFTPQEAWDRLGLYGGDDGVTPDVDAAHYVLTARRFGLKLKAQPVLRGELGVTFLGRTYGPGVWNLDPNSMCDLERWLCRFHCTSKVDCSPLEKLLEKCRALSLTDHDTPFVREFLDMVKRLWGKDWPDQHWDWRLWKWGSDFALAEQYPNVGEEWMLEVARAIAERLNFSEDIFLEWVASRTDLESVVHHDTVFAVPIQPSVDALMVIGDELHMPSGEGMDNVHPLELLSPEPSAPAEQPVTPSAGEDEGLQESKQSEPEPLLPQPPATRLAPAPGLAVATTAKFSCWMHAGGNNSPTSATRSGGNGESSARAEPSPKAKVDGRVLRTASKQPAAKPKPTNPPKGKVGGGKVGATGQTPKERPAGKRPTKGGKSAPKGKTAKSDGVGENQYSHGRTGRRSDDRAAPAKKAGAKEAKPTANKAVAASRETEGQEAATAAPTKAPPRKRPAPKCKRDIEGVCPLGPACSFRHMGTDTQGGKAYGKGRPLA